ncbi:MAG: TerB family tellurite resistance protein [Anaerolineae bacterium]|nr:TerB family tellurite resistance protein [Anaerolineae bacterium]
MNDNQLIMALAKVIIAAAWADGAISEDEEICLKDLLWRIPEINAQQWNELEIYLASPVGAVERERLVGELHSLASSPDQRALAFSTLDEMVNADGTLTAAERDVVAEIKSGLETVNTGSWGSFSRLLIGRRAQVTAAAPNREAYLNDFVRNRVYYNLRLRLQANNISWDISDEEMRRLGLAGGLLALLARVSGDVTGEEQAAMTSALQRAWSLSPESAQFVVEVALADGDKLDLYRLLREICEVTTDGERRALLDALFAIAAADGQASFQEIEELRLVAQGLKLSHQEFIDAKLKLPRTQRAA